MGRHIVVLYVDIYSICGIIPNKDETKNNAANGVFLRTTDDVPNGLNHNRVHTDKYYKNVYEIIEKAESKPDLVNLLAGIRDKLLDGTFPIN